MKEFSKAFFKGGFIGLLTMISFMSVAEYLFINGNQIVGFLIAICAPLLLGLLTYLKLHRE